MRLFKTILNIYLYKLIIVSVAIVVLVLLLLYYKEIDAKHTALLGGLATGLIVAGLQLLLSWTEHIENEKIKRLRVKQILATRDDEKLYRSIIDNANRRIFMLANTAYRFLEDFADEDMTRQDKRALIQALERGVSVEILLPDAKYLTLEDDKYKAKISARKFSNLKTKFGDKFQVRYYNHSPAHNLLIVDHECLAGPIFPDISSKNSPAIYTDDESPFIKPYLKYFEVEWDKAAS